MPLETATYISDLVPTNPLISDNIADGPSHFWLIKKAIQNTFPNIKGAITASQDQLNTLTGLLGSSTSDVLDLKGNLTVEGSLTVSDGVDLKGNLTVEGKALVPSVTDWTSKQAVPASDADARYLMLSSTAWQNVTGIVSFTGDTGFNAKITNAPASPTTGVGGDVTNTWWVDQYYARKTALQSEADARTQADTSLSSAITSESSRAQAAEAGKANLSGGNNLDGSQTINYGNLTLAGNTNTPNTSQQVIIQRGDVWRYALDYMHDDTNGNYSRQIFYDASTQNVKDILYYFLDRGRLSSASKGDYALTSDLPFVDKNLRVQVWKASAAGDGALQALPQAFRVLIAVQATQQGNFGGSYGNNQVEIVDGGHFRLHNAGNANSYCTAYGYF